MPLAWVRSALVSASVVGWAPAAPSSSARRGPERPEVVLWPASSELVDDMPADIDARFELRPREPLLAELAAARTVALARDKDELAAIERALAVAREAFVAQRFDDMEAALVAAERDHAVVLTDPASCATLWEIEFRLGLAYQFRGKDGDRERMQERYSFALALDGDRRPAREIYGPDVLAAFLAVVDARAGRVARPLSIGTRPRDAELFVDGRPATGGRVDLGPGLHAVHARAPGFSPAGRVAETTAIAELTVALTVWPDDDPIARFGATSDPELDPRRASARRSLAAATTTWGADVTVLAWRSEGRAAARALVGAGDGPVIVRDSFAAAIDGVLAGIDDAGKLRPAPTIAATRPVDPEPRKPRKPIARTWWFWTILGTVVVGSVALAVGLTVPKQAPDRLVITGPR